MALTLDLSLNFPISLINGKLYAGEGIYSKGIEIGKVLIDEEYPFALIKYRDKNFEENIEFKTKEAALKSLKKRVKQLM